jgi:hypothetical protein
MRLFALVRIFSPVLVVVAAQDLIQVSAFWIVCEYENHGDYDDHPDQIIHSSKVHGQNLVGVYKSAHSSLDAKNVVVDGPDIIGYIVGCADDSGRVESAEVERASRLKF